MSRTRLVLLSVLAVLAANAAASASAGAHAFLACKSVGVNNGKYKDHLCKEEGGEKEWEYRTVGLSEKIKVEGTAGVSQLEIDWLNAQLTIECAESRYTGEILAEGKTTGEVTFSGCGLSLLSKSKHKEQIPNCTIPNISFKFRDLLVNGNGHGPEEEFKTESAETNKFVEFEITGASCTLKGKYALEVTEKDKGVGCAFHEPFAAAVVHEVICTSTGDGGNLRFGGMKASFFSAGVVQLVGSAAGWHWYAE